MVDPLITDPSFFSFMKLFIGDVGFPIFVSGYLLYMKHKQDEGTFKLIEELKCVQAQLLETKLQIGDKVGKS
jgi:hypothetical protein